MRGRPARELLRRLTLLTAATAALVVVPAAEAAGGPSPDRAPSGTATLAPDPAPGAKATHGTSTPVRPVATAPASTPVSIPPAVTPVAATPKPSTRAAAVHHARKRTPAAKPKPTPKPQAPIRFVLPRIAVPSLAAIVAAPSSHDADVALAGLALLLAAVTAGSGARLVAVWSRRE